MSMAVRKLWSAVFEQMQPDDAPVVVVHDPSAAEPHNLDDPFLDDQVRGRIAGVIANTGNRKTKNSY